MSQRLARPPARRALVDSGAFFAAAEMHDANYSAARAISDGLAQQHWRIFTTNFVIAEAHALILTRRGRALAARFLTSLSVS